MLWAAWLPPPDARPQPWPQALTHWALSFTPRVTCQGDAVLMEVQASLRLFGGWPALRARVEVQGRELGLAPPAWAPQALAALALARAGLPGTPDAGPADIDPLPLTVLDAAVPHAALLAQTGCHTLGDLRRRPRGALARRFGAALLEALDQAHGLRPSVHAWVTVPDRFEARLELPWRVEQAEALVDGARRLLLPLQGWLTARQAGVRACRLRWLHDGLRPRDAGPGGELLWRTATPTRDIDHLQRLLAEHLAQVTLQAPVGELVLEAVEVQPLQPQAADWWADPARAEAEALQPVLERLAARLGPQRVLRPVLCQDHRPEAMVRWCPTTEVTEVPEAVELAQATAPAAQRSRPRRSAPAVGLQPAVGPQPGFLRPQPLRLAVRGHRPHYQGELQLLVGPQRVEGGWWDGEARAAAADPPPLSRDYWVAHSPRAGLLWVFCTRPVAQQQEPAWYLHGHFA
jgi:protein ImuB